MKLKVICCLLVVFMFPLLSNAQNLRFGNHREVKVPDYALIRIGSFYSDLSLISSVGYRYVESSGTGVDYLFRNRLGEIKEDGSDFPIILEIQSQNYLLISENTDLDLSFKAGVEYYPLDTQENESYIDLIDEGAKGNFTMEFQPSPFVRILAYDKIDYKSDYVDPRGRLDRYSGSQYEHLKNEVGIETDWLIDKNANVALTLAREDNFPMDDEYDSQEYFRWKEDLAYEHMISPFVLAGLKAEFWQADYNSTGRTDSAMQSYSVFSEIKATDFSVISISAGYSLGSVDDELTIDSVTDNSQDSDLGSVIGSFSLNTKMSEELSHMLGYSREMDGGFNTAFEIIDKAMYKIDWKTDRASVSVYTDYDSVDPRSDTYSDYTDWTSGLKWSYKMSDYLALGYKISYSIRDNAELSTTTVEELDESLTQDYSTLDNRLKLTMAVTENIDFVTYVEHEDRSSDSPDLDYDRFTGGAVFTYKHQF
ncbi:hypothetical protein BVX94_03830 [bacterium B17]|nr:hypothetical protein BVX94_03830 [bacterium B17]